MPPPPDTPPPVPALTARSLGKRFGRRWALAHFDLDLEAGQVLLLAGSNGSGKTTLLRLIAGLYRPSRGELRIFGIDPGKETLTCRRSLSMVAHDSYLYDRLTALETLRVWARLGGAGAAEGDLTDLLGEVDLADRRDHLVGSFSAGMRKRLTLLRTKLENPRLVLLDEPFSALDTQGQEMVQEWIAGFRSAGRTVILASHNLRQAAVLSDRVVMLQQGQISWSGSGEQLLARLEGGG